MESFVRVRVTVTKFNYEKSFDLPTNITAQRAANLIHQHFFPGDLESGSDHGLLWTSQNKWLDPLNIMGFYDMRDYDVLEYRKKHYPMKIQLSDFSQRIVYIDASTSTAHIAADICNQIGLLNPKEYALAIDEPAVAAHEKKLKRSASFLWLKATKTLAEQNITCDTTTLLLKRKLYFSDLYLDDLTDEQLHLVYCEEKSFLETQHERFFAFHPDFIGLSALQHQADYGDFVANQVPISLLNGFSSAVFSKMSKRDNISKLIQATYQSLKGIKSQDAKMRYINVNRRLPFYGHCIFKILENSSKRNRTERFLSVSRDGVSILDYNRLECIYSFSFYQIRRWTSTPSSFSLDLGEYTDQSYVVCTTQGEEIASYISGYIDILLHRKQDALLKMSAKVADDEFCVSEEFVTPIQASIVMDMSKSPVSFQDTLLAMNATVKPFTVVNEFENVLDSQQRASVLQSLSSSDEQQTLIHALHMAAVSIQAPLCDFGSTVSFPVCTGNDEIQKWQQQMEHVSTGQILAEISAIACSSAAVCHEIAIIFNEKVTVIQTGRFITVAAHISTISTNFIQLSSSIRMLAMFMNPNELAACHTVEKDTLIASLRTAAASLIAFLDMVTLCALKNGSFDDLAATIESVGSVFSSLIKHISKDENSLSPAGDDITQCLQKSAKALKILTGHLISMASFTHDSDLKITLTGACDYALQKQSEFKACAAVLLNSLHDPACVQQLLQASQAVNDVPNTFMNCITSANIQDSKWRQTFEAAIAEFRSVQSELVSCIQNVSNSQDDNTTTTDNGSTLPLISQRSTESLCEAINSTGRLILESAKHQQTDAIILHAQHLTECTAEVVGRLKTHSKSEIDPEERHRWLCISRDLAETASRLINIIKCVARDLKNTEFFSDLRLAVDDLMEATRLSSAIHDRQRVLRRLAVASKAIMASCTHLVSATRAAASCNRNAASQENLLEAARNILQASPQITVNIRNFVDQQQDTMAQLELITSCRFLQKPSTAFVAAARVAITTISDPAVQLHLTRTTSLALKALEDMNKCLSTAELFGAILAVENARETINHQENLVNNMLQCDFTQDELKDDNALMVSLEMYGTVKSMRVAIMQLDENAFQSRVMTQMDIGFCISDVFKMCRDFVNNSLAVAKTSDHAKSLTVFLNAVILFLKYARDTCDLIRKYVQKDDSIVSFFSERLVIHAEKVLECMPGRYETREVLARIDELQQAHHVSSSGMKKDSHLSQETLATAVKLFTVNLTQLLHASCLRFSDYNIALHQVELSCCELWQVQQELLSSMENKTIQNELTNKAIETFTVLRTVLLLGDHLLAEPHDIQLRSEFSDAIQQCKASASSMLERFFANQRALSLCDLALAELLQIHQEHEDNALQSTPLSANSFPIKYSDDNYLICTEKLTEIQGDIQQNMSSMLVAVKTRNFDLLAQLLSGKIVRESIVSMLSVLCRIRQIVEVSSFPAKKECEQSIYEAQCSVIRRARDVVMGAKLLVTEFNKEDIFQQWTFAVQCLLFACNELVRIVGENTPQVRQISLEITKIARFIMQIDGTYLQSAFGRCDGFVLDISDYLPVNSKNLLQEAAFFKESLTRLAFDKELQHPVDQHVPVDGACHYQLPLSEKSLELFFEKSWSFMISSFDAAKRTLQPALQNSLLRHIKDLAVHTQEYLSRIRILFMESSTASSPSVPLIDVSRRIDMAMEKLMIIFNSTKNMGDSEDTAPILLCNTLRSTLASLETDGDIDHSSAWDTNTLIITIKSVSSVISKIYMSLATQPRENGMRLLLQALVKEYSQMATIFMSSLFDDVDTRTKLKTFLQHLGQCALSFIDAVRAIQFFPDDPAANARISDTGNSMFDVLYALSTWLRQHDETPDILCAYQRAASQLTYISSEMHATKIIASLDENTTTCMMPSTMAAMTEQQGILLQTITSLSHAVNALQQNGHLRLLDCSNDLSLVVDNAQLIGTLCKQWPLNSVISQVELLAQVQNIQRSLCNWVTAIAGTMASAPHHRDTLDSQAALNSLTILLDKLRADVIHSFDMSADGNCLSLIIASTTQSLLHDQPASANHLSSSKTLSDVTVIGRQVMYHIASLISDVTVASLETLSLSVESIGHDLQEFMAYVAASFARSCGSEDSFAEQTLRAVRDTAATFLIHLQATRDPQSPTHHVAALVETARLMADSIGRVVALLQSTAVDSSTVTPSPSNVYLNRDLLGAAGAIEVALEKVDLLRTTVDEACREGKLLTAVRAIAAATSTLIVSATAAQGELIRDNRTLHCVSSKYFDDGTWTEGLLSAAKTVAATAVDLCESTHLATLGNVPYERVVASARQVSADTAHLLTAATIQLHTTSIAREKLHDVGKKIRDAAERLETIAWSEQSKRPLYVIDENTNVTQTTTTTLDEDNRPIISAASKVSEMEAQTIILMLERDLEMARERLSLIRKNRYHLHLDNANIASATSPQNPRRTCHAADLSFTDQSGGPRKSSSIHEKPSIRSFSSQPCLSRS